MKFYVWISFVIAVLCHGCYYGYDIQTEGIASAVTWSRMFSTSEMRIMKSMTILRRY